MIWKVGLDESGTGSRIECNSRLIPRPFKELTFLQLGIASLYSLFADFAFVVYLPNNFLKPCCPYGNLEMDAEKKNSFSLGGASGTPFV